MDCFANARNDGRCCWLFEIESGRANWGHLSPRNAGRRRSTDYFVFPSASYCEMKAQRSPASFSFLMPAKDILVPGIFALGSLMYSLNTVSFQVMPEFLLASE